MPCNLRPRDLVPVVQGFNCEARCKPAYQISTQLPMRSWVTDDLANFSEKDICYFDNRWTLIRWALGYRCFGLICTAHAQKLLFMWFRNFAGGNKYVCFILMAESVGIAVFPAAWGDVLVFAVNRQMTRRLGDYPSSCRSSTALRATFQSLRRASSSFSSATCLKLGPVRLVDDAS